MEDTIRILIRPHKVREHHEVVVTIYWGSIPPRVRKIIGYWKPLQYVCSILAHEEKVPPETYYLDVEALLVEEAREQGLVRTLG